MIRSAQNDFYDILTDTFAQYKPDSDDKNGESYQKLFKNSAFQSLMNNAPSLVLIYNYVLEKYEYISKNFTKILGVPEISDVNDENSLKDVSALFYPPHREYFIQNITPVVIGTFIESGKAGEAKKYRYCVTLRCNVTNPEPVWVSMQMHILETAENNMPLLSMSFVSIVDNRLKNDNQVYCSISKLQDSGKYSPIFFESYPKPEKTLSIRELEILNLISEGKSSKEIASKFDISYHTVITHRKNMLQKTMSKNTSEMVKLAKDCGWI